MSGRGGPPPEVIQRDADERMRRDAQEKLARQLPPGCRKARVWIECCDCKRKWSRTVDFRDRQAPAAFHDLVADARVHTALAEHLGGVNLTVEPLS